MPEGVCEFCKAENRYGELREVNGFWYHHSQFDTNGKLISPDYPQAVVKNKTTHRNNQKRLFPRAVFFIAAVPP